MKDFTNADRSQRARDVLENYNGDNDTATNAVDFLTDLHFYNLAQKLDDVHPSFEDALQSARGHFDAEAAEAARKALAARRLADSERRNIAELLVREGQPLHAGKTYFKLFHGRNRPDENLDDWGFAGPVFGPLDWFHITYLQTYRFGRGSFETEIAITEDMFVWDGKYYGDAEIFVAGKSGENT